MQTSARPVQKIHFLFSFGVHADSADFLKAKAAADKFRPHIYAAEEPYLTRQQRNMGVVEINQGLQKARKNPFLRKKLLEGMAKPRDNRNPDYDAFERDQMAYIIDSNFRLVMHPIEAHDGDFHTAAMQKQTQLMHEASVFAAKGDLEQAARAALEGHSIVGRSHAKREADIIENMKTYREEILEFLPFIARFNPLRVFSRLGCLHSSLYVRALKEFGEREDMKIERVFDSQPMRFIPEEQIQRNAILGKATRNAALRSLVYAVVNAMYKIRNQGKEDRSKREHILEVSTRLKEGEIIGLFRKNASGLVTPEWVFRVASEAERLALSR